MVQNSPPDPNPRREPKAPLGIGTGYQKSVANTLGSFTPVDDLRKALRELVGKEVSGFHATATDSSYTLMLAFTDGTSVLLKPFVSTRRGFERSVEVQIETVSKNPG